MFKRSVNPSKLNSFFLFGARGTGKTTWLKQHFKDNKVLWFNLLDSELEEVLANDPKEFSRRIEAKRTQIEWVIVDEVQKIPKLLDLVHHHIETDQIKFALTGSSARKLKRGAANLLAGRAFVYNLFPLTFYEYDQDFALDEILHWGSLPQLSKFLTDQDKSDFLRAYAQTYLTEEIVAEQIIRKLVPFRRFLQVASQSNGKIINASQISKDIGSTHTTVTSYFEILEDTYIGFQLHPFKSSFRKRLSQKPKFYFFDCGVVRALAKMLDVPLKPRTSAYGDAFEHFIILEIYRLCQYFKPDYQLSYIQTKDGFEVDLVLEVPAQSPVLIEIKSTDRLREDQIQNLKKVRSDFPDSKLYCLSQDKAAKKIGDVSCLYWKDGLKEIFEI